jgi:hypothetical protein
MVQDTMVHVVISMDERRYTYVEGIFDNVLSATQVYNTLLEDQELYGIGLYTFRDETHLNSWLDEVNEDV